MMQTVALNNSITMPAIGLGFWMVKDKNECITELKAGLAAGYRHIDTAQAYGNEAWLGEALKACKIPRKDLFITTKIWNDNLGWENLPPSFDASLQKLQTEYVDLLLIHFPVTEERRPSWRKMEEIYKSGRAKTIGVSNYMISHLEELLRECSVKPAVNQIELHVYLQQPELVKFCKDNEIVVEAYSPLAHGYGIDNPVLAQIGNKYDKSPAQVMIRWCIDAGTIPLPKSVHPDRIKENIEVFDFSLDKQDMAELAKLDADIRTCWDPTHVA